MRQQLAVLRRTAKLPELRPQDRLFWATPSEFWKNWRAELYLLGFNLAESTVAKYTIKVTKPPSQT